MRGNKRELERAKKEHKEEKQQDAQEWIDFENYHFDNDFRSNLEPVFFGSSVTRAELLEQALNEGAADLSLQQFCETSDKHG